MAGPDRLSALGQSVLDRVGPDLPPGPVMVALSGGADSAVCAWAAVAGQREVRVVHVDHGLPASPALAEAARRVASTLGVDLDVVTVVVEAGASAEGRARDARYRALEEAAKPAEALLSGHTADDQAETVLGHLLRGAGAEGLSGIPRRRGRWHRPLLEVTRAETRALADELGLPYFDDPANADRRHRRNRIRNELLPRLEAEYNPELRAALRRSGRLLASDDAELDRLAQGVPIREMQGAVLLPAPLLATLSLPVASRAVRRGLRTARGPYAGLGDEVDAVVALAASSGGSVSLQGGLQATREGPWVALHLGDPGLPEPAILDPPGSVEWGPWLIRAEVADRPPVTVPRGRLAVLAAAQVGARLNIRCAEPGERIELKSGSKKVATVLSEAGAARRLRAGWPVAEAHGKIAWIGGLRTAVWAAATPATESFLTLRMEEK